MHHKLQSPRRRETLIALREKSNILTVRIEPQGNSTAFRDRLPLQHSSSHSVRRRHENGLRVLASKVLRDHYYHNFESDYTLAGCSTAGDFTRHISRGETCPSLGFAHCVGFPWEQGTGSFGPFTTR
jgi:hypothetical protein